MIAHVFEGRRFFLLVALTVVSAFGTLLSPSRLVAAADAPFGTMFNLPNYPFSIESDYITALRDVSRVGGFSGFIWHWDKQENLAGRVRDIANMKRVGLTTVAQISVAVLGEPNPPEGYVRSFGDPDTRALYLDNVKSIAAGRPDYLVLATEANFMKYWMPREWEMFVDIYREAAAVVRALSPRTQIGVSFHYGMFIWQNNAPLLDELGDYDFAAFTSYPGWLIADGHYKSVEDIPPEWYGMIRLYYPDLPVLFTEVGWSSGGMSSEEEQRRYIENLPRLFSMVRPEMICYVFTYDVDYFKQEWIDLLTDREKRLLDDLGVDLSLLFSRFNSMGLMYDDGTPKPAWDAALGVNKAFREIAPVSQ